MKITKFIIPLVLGLAGGLIAYFIADNFGSKTIQSTLQHQIVGPALCVLSFINLKMTYLMTVLGR